MKMMFLSLLLGAFPIASFCAGDGCMENGKHENEYKIDKRCYVTDEQKQQSPFDATVALVLDDGYVYCSGAIININDKNYLITAKHCTDSDQDGVLAESLTIRLQDGRQIAVSKVANTGNYDTKTQANHEGDWIFYELSEPNLPFVHRTNKKIGTFGQWQAIGENLAIHGIKDTVVHFYKSGRFNVYSVGYGALEIMSDSEIRAFKERYAEILKENNMKDDWFNEHQVVDLAGETFNEVLKNNLADKEWGTLFSDTDKLKVSYCNYTIYGDEKNCQAWGGNSGGPIFDRDNNIIAIQTRGTRFIGENPEEHARAAGNVSLMTPARMNIGKLTITLE